jgi:hypothetical protein
MKKLMFPIYCVLFFSLVSCHNYERSDSKNIAGSTSDSTLKADSIRTGTNSRNDRVVYIKALQFKIDSMQTKLNKFDSISQNKLTKEAAKWHENRKHVIASIQRLKDKLALAGSVAENKWQDFKQQMDTAIRNIKDDWKYGE